jgi:hypothetical protein
MGANGNHRVRAAVHRLHHVEVAILIARVKGFHRHGDQEIATR